MLNPNPQCTTTTTTTINPNDYLCLTGCAKEFDASCVDYTELPLGNINILSGYTLEEILIAIDGLTITKTTFIANSTNSIKSTIGGVDGHAPVFEVRINPAADNLIKIDALGLFVDKNSGGDGKVSVDGTDSVDYLENKVYGGSDGVLTITTTKASGKIKAVPTLDIQSLLETMESDYLTELCTAFGGCAAEEQ